MKPHASSSVEPMATPIRVGVMGLGRMGVIHALHVHELARETGICTLAAVSTLDASRAEILQSMIRVQTPTFASIDALQASGFCDVTVIATNTELHREHTLLMIEQGHRVLLEKPLTGTLEGDRSFAGELNDSHPQAVMLGFQRRFDEPLLMARKLIQEGRIGRVFKIYSALEDSTPAPSGFQSPGILPDMGIHNVDEVLWLSGRMPMSGMVIGNRIFSHRLTTCQEDFDDALMVLHFQDELVAHIEVSRNHVSGYRGETVVYGEKGKIQIGRFCQNPHEVLLEIFDTQSASRLPETKTFHMRRYDQELPEFVGRFGAAYKQELKVFLQSCRNGGVFPVTPLDALRAQEIVAGAMKGIVSRRDMAPIDYMRLF